MVELYEAKYNKYVTQNKRRFAEPDEIAAEAVPLLSIDEEGQTVANAGAPLYYDDGCLYIDNEDTHTLIIGSTGCKKSRTSAWPTLASIIEAGESAVVNDPKAEIYKKTAARARAVGANVHVLNFRDPQHSEFWNPFYQAHQYYSAGMEVAAIQCITDFVESVCAESTACCNDRYWPDTAKSFLNALMQILMDSVPPEYFNIRNLIPLCYEENSDILDSIKSDIDQTSPAAYGLHVVLDLEAERTKSSIYSMLLSILSPFAQNRELMRILSDTSFDPTQLAYEQTIIYIIYPDEKNTLSFLVNAFFTQTYEALVTMAAGSDSDRLPIRVNFLLDEFSNLPSISNFSNRISEARSRNIRFFLFIQSYNQLRHKYGESAETILSNCNNWICYNSKEMEFLEKISSMCGSEIDYSGDHHPLISPSDMQMLRKSREWSEALIIRQGRYPYVTELPDFDYLDCFTGYGPSSLSEIESGEGKAVFIDARDWYEGIGSGKFHFPFRKKRKKKKYERRAAAARSAGETTNADKLFSELFGDDNDGYDNNDN